MKYDIYWKHRTHPLYLVSLALISAIAIVGRSLFTFLPNIQPITVIFLLVTVIFGTISGNIVVFLTIMLSSIQHGFGPWVIHQLVAYGLLTLLNGILLSPTILIKRRVLCIVWAGLSGYLYGIVISMAYALSIQMSNPLAYYIAGIPFDTYHAIGNVGFYIILTPLLLPLLKKVRHRIEVKV